LEPGSNHEDLSGYDSKQRNLQNVPPRTACVRRGTLTVRTRTINVRLRTVSVRHRTLHV